MDMALAQGDKPVSPVARDLGSPEKPDPGAVPDCLEIKGDVDAAIGNVEYPKSIAIRGGVRGGISVEAGGDLKIEGLVEDGKVRAGGNIEVTKGFVGQGIGEMSCEGNIRLGWAQNQTVKAGKTLQVAGGALRATLMARETVSVQGAMVGGLVRARQSITCGEVGAENGVATRLDAGLDFRVVEEIGDIRGQFDRMERYGKTLGQGLSDWQDLQKSGRKLNPDGIALIYEMEGMKAKIQAKMTQLQRRLNDLKNQAEVLTESRITVLEKVHPGVILRIGEVFLRIKALILGPVVFTLHHGNIEAHRKED